MRRKRRITPIDKLPSGPPPPREPVANIINSPGVTSREQAAALAQVDIEARAHSLFPGTSLAQAAEAFRRLGAAMRRLPTTDQAISDAARNIEEACLDVAVMGNNIPSRGRIAATILGMSRDMMRDGVPEAEALFMLLQRVPRFTWATFFLTAGSSIEVIHPPSGRVFKFTSEHESL